VIHFSLCCVHAHRFDGWFRSNEDYDKQCESGLVSCPICGSTEVDKALMTPALANKTRQEDSLNPVSSLDSAPLDSIEAKERALWQQWHEIARKIRANADYVGKGFPEEARKIHFGEVKPRAIYGEAKAAEITSLLEDGIEVMPLPPLPEKQN